MKLLSIIAVVIYSGILFAAEGSRIECKGSGLKGGVETEMFVSGQLLSPWQLGNVLWTSKSAKGNTFQVFNRMDGKYDASTLSPQDGIRFYFNQGRTSEFLLIPPVGTALQLFAATAEEIRQSVRQGDHKFEFPMQHIWENYGLTVNQEIIDLHCVPQ